MIGDGVCDSSTNSSNAPEPCIGPVSARAPVLSRSSTSKPFSFLAASAFSLATPFSAVFNLCSPASVRSIFLLMTPPSIGMPPKNLSASLIGLNCFLKSLAAKLSRLNVVARGANSFSTGSIDSLI